MRHIGRESARTGRLIEDLLTLARLDEERPMRREPVDMTAVARDAVVEASASHPSRPTSLQADGPVVVTGEVDVLRQVADNLVGNALSQTRAPVTVTVAGNHCGAELVVPDTGGAWARDRPALLAGPSTSVVEPKSSIWSGKWVSGNKNPLQIVFFDLQTPGWASL